MVPSSCSTRTKLPDASEPRPLCEFSVFTTTPARAAMIGVPTGIAIALPAGYVALVCPRSGLALRLGIGLVNSPGVVDAGYRVVAMDLRGYGGSDHTPHGYDPLTLADDVATVTAADAEILGRQVREQGVEVIGLHWLLAAPAGLSIATEDRVVWQRSVDVMLSSIELCADLGGAYLVHGSPAQRRVALHRFDRHVVIDAVLGEEADQLLHIEA